MEFFGFPKIPRLKRECVFTEKIDGTNAQIHIRPADFDEEGYMPVMELGVDTQIEVDGKAHYIRAGSRNKWLGMVKPDNMGFGAWVHQHAHELAKLGPGQHFGEWWGAGIRRTYGLTEKRFSLFNTARWTTADRPECCSVVPVLHVGGLEDTEAVLANLRMGSRAARGFARPEGIVVYHSASRSMFKVLLENDELPKGVADAR